MIEGYESSHCNAPVELFLSRIDRDAMPATRVERAKAHDDDDDDDAFITSIPVATTREILAKCETRASAGAGEREPTYASTAALRKMKACERATSDLEDAKRDFESKSLACEDGERDVRAAQARIRSDVARFEAFVRDNEVKRHAAARRAKEERAANVERDEALREMREELCAREREEKSLDRALTRVRAFEEFLTRVVDEAATGEAFEDVADVLGRHDTLGRAYGSLRATVVATNARAEETREAVERAMKHMEEERLMTTASMARLRLRDEDLRRENGRLEQDAAYKARTTMERTRQLAEAKMAVRNLANRCAREGQRAADGSELDFIDERARVLRFIAATATNNAPSAGSNAHASVVAH